jgi:hypothetical protein
MLYRKLILVMLVSLFLVGCVSTGGLRNTATESYDDFLGKFNYGGKSTTGSGAGLEQVNYNIQGPKKGIVVNFRKDKPPSPINGDFEVEVLVANYIGSYDLTLNSITGVNLDVYDSIELDGFEDQMGISLQLDPPIFDGKQFIKPSVYTFNPNRNFNYYGKITGATNTQLIARIQYNVMTETEVNFCVSNPDKEFDPKCDSKTLEISDVNNRYPVKITSISKKAIGKSNNNVEVLLDINIADQGSGEILSNPIYGTNYGRNLNFNIISVSGLLTCTSKNNVDKSKQYDSEAVNLPMVLDMSTEKAAVECKLLVPMSQPTQSVKFKINTEYGYEYTDTTGSIKVNG